MNTNALILTIIVGLYQTLNPADFPQTNTPHDPSLELYKVSFSDRNTHVYKAGSPDPSVIDEDTAKTQAVAFSPCGNYLVTGTDRSIERGSTRLYRLMPDSSLVFIESVDSDNGLFGTTSVAFSACGTYVATGISRGLSTGTSRLYTFNKDPLPGQQLLSLVAYADGDEMEPDIPQPITIATTSMAFSPCGHYLVTGIRKASGSAGYSTKLYAINLTDPDPGRRLTLLALVDHDSIFTRIVAFSPCGNYLATGVSRLRDVHDATTRLYWFNKRATKRSDLLVRIADLDGDSEERGTHTLAFSSDGASLATGVDTREKEHTIGSTRVYFVRPDWLASSKAPYLIAHTNQHTYDTTAVIFNHRGRTLITSRSSKDGVSTVFYAFNAAEADWQQRLTEKIKLASQRKTTVCLALTPNDAHLAAARTHIDCSD